MRWFKKKVKDQKCEPTIIDLFMEEKQRRENEKTARQEKNNYEKRISNYTSVGLPDHVIGKDIVESDSLNLRVFGTKKEGNKLKTEFRITLDPCPIIQNTYPIFLFDHIKSKYVVEDIFRSLYPDSSNEYSVHVDCVYVRET